MKKDQRGVALLVTVLILSMVTILTLYFLNFAITEHKIATSQIGSNSTYYLAEAAINDVIWKLQNDPIWRASFTGSATWSTTTTRVNPLGYNGSYTASLNNYSAAHAYVVATATTIMPNGKTSQRVVKVNIYRATGNSSLGDNAMLSDGTITISNSEIDFKGGLHSNNSIIITNNSDISIIGNLEAVGNFTNQNGNSSLSVSSTSYAANLVAGAAPIFTLPAVDFNSSATSSMKNRAARIYTAAQFMNLCTGGCKSITLPSGITYVIGNININNNWDLTINQGALVVEGTLSLTLDELNVTQNPSGPSGLFASGNLSLTKVKEIDNVFEGVIYSNATLTFGNIGSNNAGDFDVTGGIAARNIIFSSPVKYITITLAPSIINNSLPAGVFSPVISTDHWEEQY